MNDTRENLVLNSKQNYNDNVTDSNHLTLTQSISEYSTHAALKNKDEEDIHICKQCDIVFYSLNDYIRHKLSHGDLRIQYKKVSSKSREVIPQLVKKNKRIKSRLKTYLLEKNAADNFSNESNFIQPLLIQPTEYKCQECSKIFRRESSLNWHVKYKHNESHPETEFNETKSDKFPESTEKFEPKSSDRNIGKFMIKACQSEQITCNDGYNKLDQEQSQNQDLKTVSCADIFMKKSFSKACRVVRGRKKKSALQKTSLLKRYLCPFCNHVFNQIGNLKTHMVTHSHNRLFKCSWENCSYSFKTNGSLKRHMRRHTGQKPYKCDLCDRVFTESGALTRHLKARTPCTKKEDLDLPRYGKRAEFNAQKDLSSSKNVIHSLSGTQQIKNSNIEEQTNFNDSILKPHIVIAPDGSKITENVIQIKPVDMQEKLEVNKYELSNINPTILPFSEDVDEESFKEYLFEDTKSLDILNSITDNIKLHFEEDTRIFNQPEEQSEPCDIIILEYTDKDQCS